MWERSWETLAPPRRPISAICARSLDTLAPPLRPALAWPSGSPCQPRPLPADLDELFESVCAILKPPDVLPLRLLARGRLAALPKAPNNDPVLRRDGRIPRPAKSSKRRTGRNECSHF